MSIRYHSIFAAVNFYFVYVVLIPIARTHPVLPYIGTIYQKVSLGVNNGTASIVSQGYKNIIKSFHIANLSNHLISADKEYYFKTTEK